MRDRRDKIDGRRGGRNKSTCPSIQGLICLPLSSAPLGRLFYCDGPTVQQAPPPGLGFITKLISYSQSRPSISSKLVSRARVVRTITKCEAIGQLVSLTNEPSRAEPEVIKTFGSQSRVETGLGRRDDSFLISPNDRSIDRSNCYPIFQY